MASESRRIVAADGRAPLRVHSSRTWLPPGREESHVTMLCPFWGRNRRVGADTWPDYADPLIEVGRDFLELTDLPEADVAVFPLAGRWLLKEPDGVERAHAFADTARAAATPPAFFFEFADTGFDRFPVADALVLRGSLLRSRQLPNEFALPGFHDDLLLKHVGAEVAVRPHAPRPVVSFCGSLLREQHPRTAAEKARRLAGRARRRAQHLHGRHEEDLFVRTRAVVSLIAGTDVETSIVVRAPGASAHASVDDARWNAIRDEYVRNMVESDYVLCARGDGNWSVRLYEALCLGRIPVFVDTDCVLPYDFQIDWRDYCVWIDRRDVSRIGEKVAGFHERLSAGEFAELQRACRRLWEDYLSPVGFFRNFHLHLSRPQPAGGTHQIASSRQETAGASVSSSST